ncbi:hypothetical protein M408DRAFT_327901 [Serendipita vermifera MAFF 305830]|uniref:Uncharacterized protein n=1 Tax=Serendipita vermifera MAFF 305830 TaxID=933852 RepID=A0A0C3B2D9_SERVB|nr:hypothetical protein M408DRAFT_327901 [Serendipita vermifera MAFF 305830]
MMKRRRKRVAQSRSSCARSPSQVIPLTRRLPTHPPTWKPTDRQASNTPITLHPTDILPSILTTLQLSSLFSQL